MSNRLGLIKSVASLMAIPFLVACEVSELPPPIDGNWLAEDIGGRGVIDRAQSTLGFNDQGGVSGSGGCNQFNGPVEKWGATLTIGPLVSTRRACTPALMDQEDRFLAALEAVRTYRFDGPWLLMADGDGDDLLRFTRLE